MKKKLFILIITGALLMGSILPVTAGLLDFETPQTDSEISIPDGYGGFDWSKMYVIDGAKSYTSSGYENGIVSGSQVAFNGFAEMAMTSLNGQFDFYSAYFTAAWNDGLNITVDGYDNGVPVYTKTITVDTTGPENFSFNFINIDELHFSSEGGIDAGLGGKGAHFAMDDFTFCPNCNPVPIPTSLILFGTGIAGIAGIKRKRRNKQN